MIKSVIPHTIYLLCGPSMCGKTTFAKSLLSYISEFGLSCQLLSSDDARNALLGESFLAHFNHLYNEVEGFDPRHSQSYLSVSPQAFQMLFASLKCAVSYPICTEAIVVDTTGMDEAFRNEVLSIAKNAHYRVELVTFEYKSRSDYFLETMSPSDREVISASLDKFLKRVLPSLKSKEFDDRVRVKSRDVKLEELSEENKNSLFSYSQCFVQSNHFAVIGDSHECVEELKELVEKLEDGQSNIQIIHNGDYLDKGNDTTNMLDFMYSRVVRGNDLLVEGNHESYIFKRLTGLVKPDLEMEKANFSSIEFLEKEEPINQHYKALFLDLFKKTRPFLIVGCPSDPTKIPVIVTHAPCENKYIGKNSQYAKREQRNYRVKDRSQSLHKELEWYYDEANNILPFHVVGHFAHEVTDKYGYRYRNKIFIDTGCVYGNRLTAVVFEKGDLEEYVSVKSNKAKVEGLAKDLGIPPKKDRPFNVNDYELDPGELRLLNQAIKNEVKYISGTMAPAPSSNGEIEPLQAAFDYFKKKGVDKVVVQTKEMGSRCQAYLFKGFPEKTFLVSRGGWRIRSIEGLNDEQFEEFCKKVYDEYQLKVFHEGVEEVILDGELLPWAALGKGLIENEFGVYESLVNDEINELCLNSGLAELPEFSERIGFEKKGEDLNSFKNSLANFTRDDPPQFKAFNILKLGSMDLSMFTESQKYEAINEDDFVVVDLTTGEGIEDAEDFFAKLTIEDGKEGVVIKPQRRAEGVLPYMKVRSQEYLRLVYGYDYLSRLDKLCRQKNISGKTRMSIKEYEIGEQMLVADPEKRKELIVKMIGNLKEEKSLDPRL